MHNDAQMVGTVIPILSASYPYTGNGLGGLSDCIEYTVTHEVNGEYEFSMKYPVTGEHFDELAINFFVTAIPDNLTPAQPFRIYRITKPLNGVVTVYARHISYDMSGIVVEPFSAGSLTEAVTVLPTKCTPASPVTIQTDRTVATGITLSEPRTLWKLLGGQAGSFLDIYGGEWDFNGLTATLKTRLGSDRGVEIRYGKNMTALEQDATIESTYAGVYPYWYDEESGTVVILPEKYVNVSGSLVTGRVLLLDLSGDFDDAPTVAQLRTRAEQYIAANSVGSAKTSWKVSFQSLEEENRALESVMLGDTLKVKYSALGVDATSRVVKVEFDGLKERYKTVTIGRVKQNLAAIIVGNNQETQEKIDASAKSAYERAVDAATESIRNGAGTFRLIYNGENLQEIVSLDNADIAHAESVWRWNNGGFGHSAHGYNGTYTLALRPDGAINADVITAGTLNANIIRAGILQDALGLNSWNLETGAFVITNGSINITTASETYDVIKLINDTWVNSLSPLELKTFNTNTKYAFRIQAGGIFGYSDYVDGTSGNIRTRIYPGSIRLHDSNGDVRIAENALTAGGLIAVYGGASGSPVTMANMQAQTYGGVVSVKNPSGQERAVINVDSNDSGAIYANNSDGYRVVTMSGNSGFTLTHWSGSTGNGIAQFWENSYGATLKIGDLSGNDRVRAEVSSSGNGDLSLYASNNVKRTDISALNIYQYNASGTQMLRLDGTNGRIYPLGSSDYIHDFIIAEGTSGTWRYRKWYSGFCELWHTGTFTRTTSQWSAWGNQYVCSTTAAQSFPTGYTFAEAPREYATLHGAGSGWLSNQGTDTTTTTSQRYEIVRPNIPSASITFYIHYYFCGMLA